MANAIRIPITNTLMDGDYTGTIYVGGQKKPANVILDTGSSTLAVDGHVYNPSKDANAKITDLAQEVSYGDGSSWVGAVVLTDIGMGAAPAGVTIPKVNTAVAFHETKTMFRNADGILGLAYARLNDALKLSGPTWPPSHSFNEVQDGQVMYLDPYFTQLEQAGVVANKFAFYTLRSMVSHATRKPEQDRLNHGYLILGGGEDSTDLYTGAFQSVRVVRDDFYSTNLKAIIVGDTEAIEIPAPAKRSGSASNSIVDSGTNGLLMGRDLFNRITGRLAKGEDRSLLHALQSGYVSMAELQLGDWPDLTFVLEGDSGQDVRLAVTPETYWQVNAPEAGLAISGFFVDETGNDGPIILGLPLMNNYFTIFDRSVDKGLGAVKFAAVKQ